MTRLLEYVIVRILLAVLRALPYDATLRFARALSAIVYHFNMTPRQRALHHLKLAYGDALGSEQREEVARGVFGTISHHVAELAHLTRKTTLALRIEHPEILQEAYALGRGVVLVSAHLGCFVTMASLPRLLRVRAAVIMKRQRNKALLRWGIRYLKRHFDLEVIRKEEARPRAVNLLREGLVVVFFSDQHAINGGFRCRFFAREVEAVRGPAVYAKRLNCPLVVVTTSLRPDGSHALVFEGPLPLEGTHEEITQRWLDVLEARIREHPEQWMWMHRRWRGLAAELGILPSASAGA
jgi:KDO2-lipid IV(A) lauroyltransferase